MRSDGHSLTAVAMHQLYLRTLNEWLELSWLDEGLMWNFALRLEARKLTCDRKHTNYDVQMARLEL